MRIAFAYIAAAAAIVVVVAVIVSWCCRLATCRSVLKVFVLNGGVEIIENFFAKCVNSYEETLIYWCVFGCVSMLTSI